MSRSSQERYAAISQPLDPDGIERLCTSEFLVEAGAVAPRLWTKSSASHRPEASEPVSGPRHDDLPARGSLAQGRSDVDGPMRWRCARPCSITRSTSSPPALPAKFKLRRGQTKCGCSSSLHARRGLPEHLVTRAKKGFGIPVGHWFRDELRPWIEDVLRDPRTRGRGWFDAPEIDRLLDAHLTCHEDHTSRLWNLAMLELWQREWIDGR